MATPRITCVFHSSPTIAALLNSPAGRPLAGDFLIECAPQPDLTFVLGLETPANYPGIIGLLGGTDVSTLANETDRLPVPIVLAPGAESAPSAIRAALAALSRTDDRLASATLLVPLSYASTLGAALAIATEFTIAWDIAEFPHEDLLEFARWLGREHLLERDTFKGVVAYASGPVDATHLQRVTALLGPLATAAHPAGVIPLAS